MILRFAPSPTGYLHVGNARVALANWLVARKASGRFLLRLDDTDAERSKPEYATAIEEDLRWLGLDWDGMFRQSDRIDRYAAAAERLKASGRLYPCFESEEELAFKRERARRQGRPPVYDREALRMTPEQRARAEANGKRPYWRFRLSMGSIAWRDGVLGERGVKLPSLSDPVLVRADGSPLYTFTSVVDDIETGVTRIIRGEDHVTNTGIQLDIWSALGGEVSRIAFAHLPLLTDEAGGPLSKRLGSVSLRQFRRDGVEPAALAGYLAALGTSGDPVAAMPAALADGYDLARVSHSTARFDTRQLLSLNRRHLHGLPFAAVRDRLPAGADEAFWLAVRGNLDLLNEARVWWEVAAGEVEAVPQPEDAAYLAEALRLLPETLGDDAWRGWTQALAAATGRKGKALYRPLRIALTGETEGPDMAALLPLIGRARAAARLARAAGA
jgi:glutamyl-tRNA synthetase